MIFPGMSEYQFATFFIIIKQERIANELQIKNLCTDIAIKTITEFISTNKECIKSKYKTQYDSLDDEEFFSDVINALKKAKEHGAILENTMCCL